MFVTSPGRVEVPERVLQRQIARAIDVEEIETFPDGESCRDVSSRRSEAIVFGMHLAVGSMVKPTMVMSIPDK